MVFDRFKNWVKAEIGPTVECPLCHTNNPEGASECAQCLYQLGKASFEQVAPVDEEEASSLFDELIGEMEEEEEEGIVDWSKGKFTMDDVTLDVEQYGEDDIITLSGAPTFSLTVDHPEPADEEELDYELQPADAPEFVTKFEVPAEDLRPLEAIQTQQLSLVEPTADAPRNVKVVAADEVPDSNGDLPDRFIVTTESTEDTEDTESAEAEAETDIESELEAESLPEVESEAESAIESQPESDEMTESNLLSMKKSELITIADEAGLSTAGTKAILTARILGEEVESDVPEETTEVTEIETEIEAEVEDEPETAPEAIPMPASVMPSPPPVAARAVDPMDAAFDGRVEHIPLTRANAIMDLPTPPRIPRIPATQAPSLPHLAAANDALDSPDQSMFWPWPQQDEWSDRDVVMKIKDAMEAAKRRDVAQATVIIDEVGPHQTALSYRCSSAADRPRFDR
ncbi:MAG: hypothetical protein ABGX06_03005 [Candidatus Poseidoniia archaeon]